MVKDVLVKVEQLTFLVDFVIMDIEEDVETPLIMGRPFMLTANCVGDMGKGHLEMSVKDQKVSFNLFDSATPTIIELYDLWGSFASSQWC